MRSRFLSTDYFFSKSPAGTLARFRPLALPPSTPLPSPDPPFASDLLFFDFDPNLGLSSEIDALPIEKALGEFLSDVVPRFIDSGDGDRCDMETSQSGNSEIELSELEDSICEERNRRGKASFGSNVSGIDLWKGFQYEILEVDFPLIGSSEKGKEDGIRFEVPEIEVPLDIINIEEGTTITYPSGVAMSICTIDNFPENFHANQDSVSFRDSSSSPVTTIKQYTKFPCFEVNEIGFELHENLSMGEHLALILPKIELWQGDHVDELMVNARELLGSIDMDIIEPFPAHIPAEHCVGQKPILFDPVLDAEVIDLNNNLLLEKDLVIYPIMPDGGCSQLPCSVHFQEFQILDSPSHDFQGFSNLPTTMIVETSEHMFNDDMKSVSTLFESVISSELALADDTFKSLPEPILCGVEATESSAAVFGDLISALKLHTFSASDRIFLDWHLLLEGICNREACLDCVSMTHEIVAYEATSGLHVSSEVIKPFDLDLLDDFSKVPNKLTSGEILTELHDVFPAPTKREEQFPYPAGEKVSILSGSMSQFSDLSYFLDVRRGTYRISDDKNMKSLASKVTPSVVQMADHSAMTSPQVNFERWHIEVHQVGLSDFILGLLDQIRRIYLAILEKNTDLSNEISLPLWSDLELLSLPMQKLLDIICKRCANNLNSGHEDETIINCIALYAIKRLAQLLCFFGVHTAHLYLNNLLRSKYALNTGLQSVKCIIEDAWWKAEKQLTDTHPSLSLIEGIISSSIAKNGKKIKILVVAERLFWLPLNRKLASMKINCHEVRDAHLLANQLSNSDSSRFTAAAFEALEHAQCFLISHEHVSASFPFNKFSIVLEYGGLRTSSTVFFISPNLDILPQLHFIKVNLDNKSLLEVFCLGYNAPQHLKPKMEGESQLMPELQRSLTIQHIIDLVNFMPIEEETGGMSSESANQSYSFLEKESTMSTSNPVKSNSTETNKSSFPDVVIIVNTQSFKKKMLFSRRSSYQKILAMEKGGTQVIERDIDLPLDLIFSAAVCLVWYDGRDFGDGEAPAEEITSLPMFVEKIATNILMSLSFAFNGCMMIFEGESSFLTAIMESSDALYAAAASLGMNLQLFCSYIAETTDEIILNCIRNAARLNGGLFQTMPESETIGESFLTRFPSINPFSAHAILSSGGVLVEFLEWSHEQRVQAVGKYHIPDESISLFSAQCRHGELGESKSVMTDCSSIESDTSSRKLHSGRKKHKYALGPQDCKEKCENALYIESQLNDDIRGHSKASQPYWFSNCPFNDEVLGKKNRIHNSFLSNLEICGIGGCGKTDEYLKDEIIENNSTLSGTEFPELTEAISFSRKSEARKEMAVRRSSTQSISPATITYHTFPTSAEVNCDKDNWKLSKAQNHDLKDKVCGSSVLRQKKGDTSVKELGWCPKDFFDCLGNSFGLSSKDNAFTLYGESVRPNTTQSSQNGPNSTMEILQRVKEKRRTLQQSLQGNKYPSCHANLKTQDKSSISLSPSIIDSYRYQGGNQMKIIKQKCNKRSRAQLNSTREAKKDSPLVTPTWTPIDKRARQNLSFTRNGNEKQSRLVWRSRNSPNIGWNARKRYRDEG